MCACTRMRKNIHTLQMFMNNFNFKRLSLSRYSSLQIYGTENNLKRPTMRADGYGTVFTAFLTLSGAMNNATAILSHCFSTYKPELIVK